MVGCALALLVATVAPERSAAQAGAAGGARCWTIWRRPWTPRRPSCASRTRQAGGRGCWRRPGRTEETLAELDEATAEGLAVVRQSPFRRRQLAGIEAYAQLSEPLDHASRNLRVLARRCAVALWRGEDGAGPVPGCR